MRNRTQRCPISKLLRTLLLQIPERGRQEIVFTYARKSVKDISDGQKQRVKIPTHFMAVLWKMNTIKNFTQKKNPVRGGT